MPLAAPRMIITRGAQAEPYAPRKIPMSQRTEQVSSQIQQLLGEIINREVELPQNHLATVSRVIVTPDLRKADVHISVLPFESSQQVVNVLKNNKGVIQKELNSNIEMKFSPKLEFFVDEQQEYAEQIDRLIEEDKANN